jgi:hypothetical protein
MEPRIILVIGLFLFAACADSKKEEKKQEQISVQPEQKDSFGISEIIPSVTCATNTAYSYALYLPHQYAAAKNLPALIFVDPHGDGAFPLGKYHLLAEKFGVILIGSNDSKNGLTFNEVTPIMQALNQEASARLQADAGQVSIAGFSGGAKAAMVAASETPSFLSLIYCGAGFPQIPKPLPPSLGIAGLLDMNYTEVLQTDQQMEGNHFRHSLIEWKGKHEWSDSTTFQNAFYWILFRAMEKKLIPVNEAMVQAFISQNSKVSSDILSEELRLKKLSGFLEGDIDIAPFTSALTALQKEKGFRQAKEKQTGEFELESRMKQNYIQCIELKNLLWWRDEVKNLRSKASPMNARILGYISLACYSYSNNALKQQNLQAAEKYLGVYSLVDRENPDRAYMQACWYGRTQNTAGVLQSLREAMNYGFKDRSKILTEEAFAYTRNTPEFSALLQEMR